MKIAEKSELKAQLRKFQTASDSYMRLLSELKNFSVLGALLCLLEYVFLLL